MKSRGFVITTLFLAVAFTNGFSQGKLRGCRSPSEIAKELGKLQTTDWKTVSVDRIQSIWPVAFDEVVCDGPKGCRFLVSKQRVIGGHCECCEAFKFELKRGADGAQAEGLSDAIFHYSNPSKTDVLRAARLLAQAAGLPEADVVRIGNDPSQIYRWKALRDKADDSYALEIRITQVESNWELYLSLGLDAP